MSDSSLITTRTIHNQTYEFYPWEQLGTDIFQLAKQIIESGAEFDRIIALAKGGLTFSRSLLDYLEVESVSSIQIQFYTGIAETEKTPVITQSLPVSIKNEKILIFDDILDTGETMKLAKQYLQYHGAQSIHTAVLIEKPWAKVPVDFSARSSEAWVIFPNEVRETINCLSAIWKKNNDSRENIEKQLLQIGFSKDEVALFAKLD
jgi:hypoxanthine phosphoribosyltransferase